jgi:glutathione S-transferase
VPALVTDDGILTETPAILAYLAQRFPQAKLAPLDDPFAFAMVQAFNSCAPQSTWRMRTGCAARAGRTTQRRSRR